MPALTSTDALVLVTGASGFAAAHIVRELLERGFRVRGTVRSNGKGEYLKKLFKSDNFEYVIVEDVEQENGHDEAVKDVDAILHTASPFHFKATDAYRDFINPAVNGTLSVLKSAAKNGKNVKRVVVFASFACMVRPEPPPYTFNESDYNTSSPKIFEEKGNDAPQQDLYRVSKLRAEQAAWDFVESNALASTSSETIKWDLTTILPPFIIGPTIHQVEKPESLNTSIATFYAFLTGKKTAEDAKNPAGLMVDVRDVARAHVESILRSDAGGKRIAVACSPWCGQDILDVFHSLNDETVKKAFPAEKVPKGERGYGKTIKANQIDTTRSKQILGLEYISANDCIRDTIVSLAERQLKEWS